jgi:hypothetical protein
LATTPMSATASKGANNPPKKPHRTGTTHMRYGLAWRLHCDKVLTLTAGPGLQQFLTFLKQGGEGITLETSLNAAIPGRFCPNFGFHFQPHNKIWPMLVDPIEESTCTAQSVRGLFCWLEPITNCIKFTTLFYVLDY